MVQKFSTPLKPLGLMLTITAIMVMTLSYNSTLSESEAAAPSQQPTGTYQFTVGLNPDTGKLKAFLLDTRNGTVYTTVFGKQKKKRHWKRWVEANFDEKVGKVNPDPK